MRRILTLLLFAALALPATAQRAHFNWEYDADFRYIFDNREFAYSNDAIIPSGTMHTIVLAPMAGFSVEQSPTVRHRLMVGVEFAHEMGSRTWTDFAREPLIFYNAHVRARKGSFDAFAGVFSRNNVEGAYGEAFFSGMFRNSDRNIDGVLLKWRAERFYAEIGFDWMGQYGPQTRERFQVFSAGRWQAKEWLQLGWSGSFYHYACSQIAPNVVDNHLLQPWAKADFSRQTRWQELSVQAGLYVAYQLDRGRGTTPDIPLGGEIKLTARRWNVMLQNTTYAGGNLMPYFRELDPAGIPYATNLYFGTPCFDGFFNLSEVAWTPQIARYVQLRLAARFYVGKQGFLGWQQIASLRFNLDALLHPATETAVGHGHRHPGSRL